MKLIFLDIDGVMNSAGVDRLRGMTPEDIKNRKHWEEWTDDNPCEPHIGVLNTIWERFDEQVELVISSTWRSDFSMIGWNHYLATLGVKCWIHGKTPRLQTDRGAEVFSYLNEIEANRIRLLRKGDEPAKKVDGFVVIDDDFDPCYRFIEDNWYCVKSRDGLLPGDVDGISEILRRPYEFPVK
jgi:hypothetical protein